MVHNYLYLDQNHLGYNNVQSGSTFDMNLHELC